MAVSGNVPWNKRRAVTMRQTSTISGKAADTAREMVGSQCAKVNQSTDDARGNPQVYNVALAKSICAWICRLTHTDHHMCD